MGREWVVPLEGGGMSGGGNPSRWGEKKGIGNPSGVLGDEEAVGSPTAGGRGRGGGGRGQNHPSPMRV